MDAQRIHETVLRCGYAREERLACAEGEALAANLNTKLFRYVYKTAKWSGFGNERVFSRLPDIPRDRTLTDHEMFQLFGISQEEVDYVERALEPRRRKTQ